MTITVSLLITLAAILLFGSWILAVAIRHADEGYEDAFGFSFGQAVASPHPFPERIPATGDSAAPLNAPRFASGDLPADATTQAAAIFVSGAGRAASALYRRHRRSGNSSASFPVQTVATSSTGSASPFALQCAVTRARANNVDSASPFPVNAKSAFGDGAAI